MLRNSPFKRHHIFLWKLMMKWESFSPVSSWPDVFHKAGETWNERAEKLLLMSSYHIVHSNLYFEFRFMTQPFLKLFHLDIRPYLKLLKNPALVPSVFHINVCTGVQCCWLMSPIILWKLSLLDTNYLVIKMAFLGIYRAACH